MRARILPPTAENLARAAQALLQGEVVGMPTETVYGLAGCAFRPDALARIFETKERPTFDPLIVHVGFTGKGIYELERLRLIDGTALSELARTRAQGLIERFWPGPLTLVLPKNEDVPELATSGLPTVAVRMPSHPVALALIAAAGVPLAAPSANRFGRISPTSAQAVAEELGGKIDWILDGGICEIGIESTVIRVQADGTLVQLRPGGLSCQQLEQAAGCAIQLAPSSAQPGTAPSAPGMLESHYAPVKPMYLLPAAVPQLNEAQWVHLVKQLAQLPSCGFLLQSGAAAPAAREIQKQLAAARGAAPHIEVLVRTLSESGALPEAARRLFSEMRSLDASAAQIIFAEPCRVERGLGHAIADRLARACRKT